MTQHLIASDDRLRSMIYSARTCSHGTHPTYGNYVADVLDALAAFDFDDSMSAADAVLDAATALHTAALEREDVGAAA